jgi:two-component system alkaline phosphatase synthesis response regulator PhoP
MSDKNIYIIDDDEHTRILIGAQLKTLGECHLFENPVLVQEEIGNKGFPDIIITDIDMPKMNGLDFLKWIRENNSDVPVLVVSAFHSDSNIFKALEMGATDFICKPFPLRNITQAVKGVFKTTAPSGGITVDKDEDNEAWVTFEFDSDFEYLRRVNNLISTLMKKKYSSTICNQIKLAIEEIGANAIEWGNKNKSNLKVTIKYRLLRKKILLWIQDDGAGFVNLGLPESFSKMSEQRLDKGKREGGYGLHLVNTLMDEVVYNETGNAVVMSLYLDEQNSSSGEAQ